MHYTAVDCITLQLTANRRNTLQHTTTHCNAQQHTATHCNTQQHTATHCNTLQHTATYCNTLQLTATHCNSYRGRTQQYNVKTLQHAETHCNAQYRIRYCALQCVSACCTISDPILNNHSAVVICIGLSVILRLRQFDFLRPFINPSFHKYNPAGSRLLLFLLQSFVFSCYPHVLYSIHGVFLYYPVRRSLGYLGL